jgi:hypothetical protein
MKYLPYIAIIALLFISSFLANQLRRKSAESDRKDTIISEKNDSVHHWKTQSGRNAVDKLAAEATAKEFQNAYPAFADELKKEFNVEIKDLKAYVRAEFEAHGQGQGGISNTYLVDSSGHRYKEFKMDDGYLAFRTMLFDSTSVSPYNYTYGDTLTYGFKIKKRWFLGDDKLYGFGGLRNPNARIKKATNVLIKDFKDKRFSVGPFVGYGFIGKQIEIGVSLQYSLIKF